MKGFLVGFLAAALIVAGAPLRAQQKPNFSGSWKMNQVKSDFGPAPAPDTFTRKIVHAEPSITIDEVQGSPLGEQQTSRKMTTDGKENTNTLRTMMGEQPVTSTSKWNGKALVTAYKLAFQDMTIDVSESWELSADGKSLTVARDFKSQQGDFSQKSVLNKQ